MGMYALVWKPYLLLNEELSLSLYEWTTLDETIDEHKAEGGHVEFTAPKGADWEGGLFIVPLCPKCNAQRGKYITIKEGRYLCKEVGANISKD